MPLMDTCEHARFPVFFFFVFSTHSTIISHKSERVSHVHISSPSFFFSPLPFNFTIYATVLIKKFSYVIITLLLLEIRINVETSYEKLEKGTIPGGKLCMSS